MGDVAMKLYMHPVSTATYGCSLNGIKCDEEMVDILRGAHYQKPYASLNPNRLVPMLEDGVLCLTESSAQKPNCTNSVVLDKSTRHWHSPD
jgi:glutathione S-transferase